MEIAFSSGLDRPSLKANNSGPVTLRLHQALAASAPEPLTGRELAQRLGVGLRTVERALSQNLKAGSVVPRPRLDDLQGHAYTVAGGSAVATPGVDWECAHG